MRKGLSWVVLVTAVAFLGLAGPPSTRAADQALYGGTLVFGIGANPETLNPGLTTNVDALAVHCKMFNGLLYLDLDLNHRPELAASWTVSRDGLVYRFTLQKGVKWHDGKPFTSADVKFTFEEILGKYHPRTKIAFAQVGAVEAPDPHTVVVRFKKPYAPFLGQMTCQDGPILPKHLYEGTDILKNPHNYDNPIGTGPFKWKEWVKGDHVTMVRNEDYFRKDMPYLDRAVAKIIPDSAARALALDAGDVDYIQSFLLLKQEVARLSKNPAVQVKFDTDLPGIFIMFFNMRNKPLSDVRVRHALATGLNRQQMVEQAVYGLGRMAKSAIHVGLKWAYNPEVDYTKLFPYDSAKANALLDQAGLKRGSDGTRFTVRIAYDPTLPGLTPMAEIARNNWQDLGIRVVMEPADRQVLVEKCFMKPDFDVTIWPYTTGGDPAIGISRAYASLPQPLPYTNPTGYSNPKVDELFNKAVETPFRNERAKHYFEVQKIIAQDLPALALIDRVEADVASIKFKGLWVSSQPYDEWDQVWWTGGKPKR